MIGKTFGKWIVLKQAESIKGTKHYECMCECGTIKIKSGTELRAGKGLQCRLCKNAELYNPDREIGKKYGKWTIIRFLDVHNRYQRYETICDCGTKGIHLASELRSEKSKQCILCHNRENAQNNRKHGREGKLIYMIWNAMHQRCKNEKVRSYRWYGARGISVCERWNSFDNFLIDMGFRPEGMTLDRINNDGNYEPGNCRWVTHKENCNNRVKRKNIPTDT